MKFTSKHAALQVPVRDAQYDYSGNPNGRLVRPAVWVDFAEEGWMETYQHSELSDQPYVALAGGGFFDTEEAQRRNGWTDGEREAAEQKLLDMCRNAPDRDLVRDRHLINADGYGDCELHVPVVPVAPWPSYGEMHFNTIVERAIEMGLEQQVIVYEERTKARPGVLDRLRAKVQQDQGAAELVAQ